MKLSHTAGTARLRDDWEILHQYFVSIIPKTHCLPVFLLVMTSCCSTAVIVPNLHKTLRSYLWIYKLVCTLWTWGIAVGELCWINLLIWPCFLLSESGSAPSTIHTHFMLISCLCVSQVCGQWHMFTPTYDNNIMIFTVYIGVRLFNHFWGVLDVCCLRLNVFQFSRSDLNRQSLLNTP